jgi:outer membrane protein assembly factor BamB
MARHLRLVLALGAAVFLAIGVPVPAATHVNWPGYLLDGDHSSYNAAATGVTVAGVATLHSTWTFTPDPPTIPGQPPAVFFASPVTYNGVVFIGADTGDFYAIDEATGTVVWKKFIAFEPKATCRAMGIVATVTVAIDPLTQAPTVYLAAPDGYLYALDAATGNVHWKAVVYVPTGTSYFAWGSALVSGGRVYVGSSSDCDHPLVRGSVQAFDQATGTLKATYYAVRAGSVGAGIWSTPTADGAGHVWITTGNADPKGSAGDANSFVRLSATSLARQDKWTVPNIKSVDLDLGASPVLFDATLAGTPTRMVGACGKDGNFYAMRSAALKSGPVWQRAIGNRDNNHLDFCLAAAIWDAAHQRLIVASNTTTVSGTSYPGSLRSLNPATGSPVWELGLSSGPILGSPSENGNGVVVAASYKTGDLFLVDATTGVLIRTIQLGIGVFSQPAWSDGYLLVATQSGLTAFVP